MTSVVSEIDITLASVADPHLTVRGKLVSIEGKYAEAALEGTTLLSAGALVQFQTAETLYLGAVESGWTDAGINHIRVFVEHSVDLARAAAIRHFWNT